MRLLIRSGLVLPGLLVAALAACKPAASTKAVTPAHQESPATARIVSAEPTAVPPTPTLTPTRTPLPSPTPFNTPAPLAEEAVASCPVTEPNGKTPPGERPSELDYGNDNDTMWTQLWPEGTAIFKPGGPGSINPDGSLSMKWPWYWSGGPLTSIEGRRLDGDAPPLRAHIGETTVLPFSPSTITFPTEGCWEVTGKTDNDSLTFVTLVVKQDS